MCKTIGLIFSLVKDEETEYGVEDPLIKPIKKQYLIKKSKCK